MSLKFLLIRHYVKKMDLKRNRQIPEPSGIVSFRNLRYAKGCGRWHKLDVYRPEGKEGPLPLLVVVHEMIEYNVDKDSPRQSHTKYTIVVRANRAAFTASNFLPMTFLQVYINLAAVIIWIIIGFYNQTYASEDSLGMLGTGMEKP